MMLSGRGEIKGKAEEQLPIHRAACGWLAVIFPVKRSALTSHPSLPIIIQAGAFLFCLILGIHK